MVSLVISAGGAGLGAGFIFSSHSLILFLHACSRLLSHFMAALKLLIASLYLPLSCMSLPLIDGGALPPYTYWHRESER